MLKKSLLAAVLSGLLSLPALAQIQIGVAGPLTGSEAASGEQMKTGAEQAVADLNAAGGLLGKQIVLAISDDACDPKQAVSVANQMIAKKAVFVAGHYCSSSSIPASKVYLEEGVLQISPASTNPKFTDEGGWNTFRTCGRDDQQGLVAGQYLAKNFKNDKIAILHDNTTYGKGLADETRKSLNAEGVKEALFDTYTPKEKDYSAVVSRLKQAGVSVIYVGGYYTEAALIIRQAKEAGLKATLVSGDALVTKEFAQIAGPAAEGTLMTFSPDPRKNAVAAAVVKTFTDKKIDPEGYVLYTYATIQIWASAVKKAGTTDAKKVAETLKSGGPWDSVLGKVSFDKKGDVTGGAYVMYIWDSKGNYSQM